MSIMKPIPLSYITPTKKTSSAHNQHIKGAKNVTENNHNVSNDFYYLKQGHSYEPNRLAFQVDVSGAESTLQKANTESNRAMNSVGGDVPDEPFGLWMSICKYV